jgi:hypothetical protein
MSPATRARLSDALAIYTDDPLDDGDAVLLLDGKVILEVPALATEWDVELCSSLGGTLRRTANEVVLALARAGADLRPADYRLWRELHQELRGTDIDLHPLHALPAVS